jgi:carbohydrate-selective porin OprB
LISLGINFMGLWDQWPDDKFGITASFSSLSPDVRELDLERALLTQTAFPLRNYELAVEFTYQALLVEGWTIQPDFQYIINPGVGSVDPINPLIGRIPNAAIFRATHCDQLLSARERVRIGRRGGKSHASSSSIPPKARNLSSQWMS